MSKLDTLNRLSKSVGIPESVRHAAVKFYLFNIGRRRAHYGKDVSSEQMRNMLSVWDIVMNDSGWRRSIIEARCSDAEGNPTPWYTLPAIEYLSQLDWTDSDVFEYGCGNSTLWWSKRAKSVTSVEADEAWANRVKGLAPTNCSIHLETEREKYAAHILNFGGFDVVVVDGMDQDGARFRCTQRAIESLRPGGLIILDNSDWLPQSSRLLREADLIEIDMAGIAPLNIYACTTSLFLSRDFSVRPLRDDHPKAAVGGITQNWEDF